MGRRPGGRAIAAGRKPTAPDVLPPLDVSRPRRLGPPEAPRIAPPGHCRDVGGMPLPAAQGPRLLIRTADGHLRPSVASRRRNGSQELGDFKGCGFEPASWRVYPAGIDNA